jgi:hypothetical protein
MVDKQTFHLILKGLLDLLDNSFKRKYLDSKISLDGSPQNDIYPPTFAQHPPNINETIRKMFVQ